MAILIDIDIYDIQGSRGRHGLPGRPHLQSLKFVQPSEHRFG